jgi:hypothetical protein
VSHQRSVSERWASACVLTSAAWMRRGLAEVLASGTSVLGEVATADRYRQIQTAGIQNSTQGLCYCTQTVAQHARWRCW